MIKLQYYQESGKVNTTGVLIVLLGAIFITLVLGYVYELILVFVPFPYLNLFAAGLTGLILGMLIRILLRFTHNRNKKVRLLLAVGAGVMLCYFQWVIYLQFLLNNSFPSPMDLMREGFLNFFHAETLDLIAVLYEQGSWSIFGVQFKGLVLAITWIIEVGIFLYMPFNAVNRAPVQPYSEILGKWYPKFTLTQDFDSIAVQIFLKAFEQNPLEAIKELKLGTAFRHTHFHVYYAPEEERQYLSAEKVWNGGGGSKESERTMVIANVEISRSVAQAILNSFEHKREQLDVF